MNVKEKELKYISQTYSRYPIVLTCGKGSIVNDENNNEYIDMGSGIAVNTFGICDDEWIKAVNSQLNKIQHTSNLYYSDKQAELAEELCKRTGMNKVFFSNSGAEANECAIKAARKYSSIHKGTDYSTILTMKNSFHGRTITTLAATGQDIFHKDFLPLTNGFCYVEPNNIDDLKIKVSQNKVAAIMFECIQGEGGVMPLTKKFISSIFEICKKNNILMITDEVQTGNGRSGMLYSYMNYNITPDIITTAKGLGGGLPIGATIFGEKVKDVFNYGDHGSTFGGNPICCAGALSILKRIDDKLLSRVKQKSEYIISQLSNAEGVKSVSGIGLMLGIETVKDANDIINECQKNGVLVIKAKNKVRLLPALNIPDELLVKAVNVIKNACK